jgi:hypothetical protein
MIKMDATPRQVEFIISLFQQLQYPTKNSDLLKNIDTQLAIYEYKDNISVNDWAKSLTIDDAKKVIPILLSLKNNRREYEF